MLIAISTNMTNQPYLTRYRLIKGRQRLIFSNMNNRQGEFYVNVCYKESVEIGKVGTPRL